ncbi:MAG: recombination protein O N-terminal domain-containing protein [Bacteroidales bacterium]
MILHAVKYGDSSLIVQAYTEQWGRASFLFQLSRYLGFYPAKNFSDTEQFFNIGS